MALHHQFDHQLFHKATDLHHSNINRYQTSSTGRKHTVVMVGNQSLAQLFQFQCNRSQTATSEAFNRYNRRCQIIHICHQFQITCHWLITVFMLKIFMWNRCQVIFNCQLPKQQTSMVSAIWVWV